MAGADMFRHHFCYAVVYGGVPQVDSIWRAHHAAETRAAKLNEDQDSPRWEVIEWKFGDAGADYRCLSGDGGANPAARYRKLPVEIDAFKLFHHPIPDWFMDRVSANTCILHSPTHADIVTLEGTMRANKGDWIIRGVKGEVYPCAQDIFEMTYEPVSRLAGLVDPNAKPLTTEDLDNLQAEVGRVIDEDDAIHRLLLLITCGLAPDVTLAEALPQVEGELRGKTWTKP